MDSNGEHHVPRIGDGVTASTLHERATAVAVPDFNYLEQCVEAIAAGLTGPRRRSGRSGKQAGADDPGGAVVAESPAVHRDAETCRRAFADARRAARSALSGFGPERHAG